MTGLSLQRVDDAAEALDTLAVAYGGRVALDVLLDDLPRRLRRTWAPGRAVHEAFRFDGRDQVDLRWWPQGVTTAADAGITGRRLAAVSWYAKSLPWDEGKQGSRVTFLDLDAGRYRHVLLVRPSGDGGVEPLVVHAGGIVWHGGLLHVAATGRGFFTCRVEDLLRVPGRDTAYGYRYVLPVSRQHRAHAEEGVAGLRYSFLSLDHHTEPPSMLAGEYTDDPARTRRLGRFTLDPTGAGDRAVVETIGSGPRRMQGVVAARERLHVTVSQGRRERGSVFTGSPGDLVEHRHATPTGNEDIAYSPAEDLLYSVSEHPLTRWLFTMRRSWFD